MKIRGGRGAVGSFKVMQDFGHQPYCSPSCNPELLETTLESLLKPEPSFMLIGVCRNSGTPNSPVGWKAEDVAKYKFVTKCRTFACT